MRLLASALLMTLALASASPAGAQAVRPERPFMTIAADWERVLARAEQAITRPDLIDAELNNIRRDVTEIQQQAIVVQAEGQVQVQATRQLLEALGPKPDAAKDQVEPDSVAAHRRALEEQLANAETRARQSELAVTRSERLLRQVLETRRQMLLSRLSAAGPSPLNPIVWGAAAREAGRLLTQRVIDVGTWRADLASAEAWRDALPRLLAVILLAVLIGWPARRWLLDRFGRRAEPAAPSYARRLLAAAVEATGRGILPALAAAAVLAVLLQENLVDGTLRALLELLASNAIAYLVVTGFVGAALAPDHAAWRLPALDDRMARRLNRRIGVVAALFFLGRVLGEIAATLDAGIELRQLGGLAIASALALAWMMLLGRSVWSGVDAVRQEGGRADRWRLVRLALGTVALAAPVSLLLGYVNIAPFLQHNLTVGAAVAALLLLLRGLARDVSNLLLVDHTRASVILRRQLALSPGASHRIVVLLELLFDLVLLLLAAAIALNLIGFDARDILRVAGMALREVRIGGLRITVTDLLFAFVLLLALLATTRYVQRYVGERLLPETRLDPGAQNSIRSFVGYAGIVLSIMVAIGATGIDLSSLALVAGALSVGIGFGLQNVVNNFVSGLVLLVERPIRVGDWIVVGGHEGIVRRINLRATEIETFRRQAVIVPNAEILSSHLVNWTHIDRTARVDVPILVDPASDPATVQEIMRGCAMAHPEVARHPLPLVLFNGIVPGALAFELRAFIENVDLILIVPSDLRHAIHKAFAEKGVRFAAPFVPLPSVAPPATPPTGSPA
jgi:small-conductance mechanosensitive channel